jgi:MFS family permease
MVAVTAEQGRAQRKRVPPELIIGAGCLIAILSFGPRSAIGVFQLPILTSNSWGSDTFSFAMAIQYLLWGAGQPFMGALADRFGSRIVMSAGTLLYAAGLALMTLSTTPLTFDLTAGVLIGLGLSGCSFNMVIAAFSKMLPPDRQPLAFGLGTAAGSLGQFLFSPLAGGLIGSMGWQQTAIIFGLLMLAIIPLTGIVATRPLAPDVVGAPREQTLREAIREALGHRSFVLLTIGFFTCGFQLAFVTVHFQKYVVEAGLAPQVGYWAFALVGIFNIAGSMSAGWLSGRFPRRYVLSVIYLSRSFVTLAFILLPPTAASTYAFGALSGLLWLSTVPPTSSLVGIMFGTRYFSTLFGFAFFSHQIGGFIGLVLSGILREQTGSYAVVWWLSIALGVFSAIVNLPIVERPVVRKAMPVAV